MRLESKDEVCVRHAVCCQDALLQSKAASGQACESNIMMKLVFGKDFLCEEGLQEGLLANQAPQADRRVPKLLGLFYFLNKNFRCPE